MGASVTVLHADSDFSMGQASSEKLKQYVARIERLEAEKSELAADISEVYKELKSFGFDPKVVRKVVSERKMDASTRQEQLSLFDIYWDTVQD